MLSDHSPKWDPATDGRERNKREINQLKYDKHVTKELLKAKCAASVTELDSIDKITDVIFNRRYNKSDEFNIDLRCLSWFENNDGNLVEWLNYLLKVLLRDIDHPSSIRLNLGYPYLHYIIETNQLLDILEPFMKARNLNCLTISLTDCHINDQDIDVMTTALKTILNCNIHTLIVDLGKNNIGSTGIKHLIGILTQSKSIKNLNLSLSYNNAVIDEEAANAISTLLKYPGGLNHIMLDLEGCRFKSVTARDIILEAWMTSNPNHTIGINMTKCKMATRFIELDSRIDEAPLIEALKKSTRVTEFISPQYSTNGIVKHCCLRNSLLFKYRATPELVSYIHEISDRAVLTPYNEPELRDSEIFTPLVDERKQPHSLKPLSELSLFKGWRNAKASLMPAPVEINTLMHSIAEIEKLKNYHNMPMHYK